MEELRDITFGLWGEKLPDYLGIQRLVWAGFPIQNGVLLDMLATIEGESGFYLKAWHANVVRASDANQSIVYDVDGNLQVKSIDLGFVQRNVAFGEIQRVAPNVDAVKLFVEKQFTLHPDLARADESAVEAYQLWTARGFQPWYAYQPGTPKWRRKKAQAAKAIADYLLRMRVGKIDANGNYLSGADDTYPTVVLSFMTLTVTEGD